MSQSDGPVNPGDYRIEGARVVGGEYEVFLAIMTEYKLTVTAGHHRDDAVEIAEELALHGREDYQSDRFLAHSEVTQLREIFEDDVEAGDIDWMDEPTAPSDDTFWDDSVHFPDWHESAHATEESTDE